MDSLDLQKKVLCLLKMIPNPLTKKNYISIDISIDEYSRRTNQNFDLFQDFKSIGLAVRRNFPHRF